ncbi:MAG: SDR family oxidoreductase [Gammaproteobacteria bacterium]|nr:SDR family oxidoreductase [Gammaproteobacteria bacterium]
MSHQSIFITGAAAGIGQATARLFAGKGWFVGLYDVDEAGVQALARELGEKNTCAGRLDVTQSEDWEAALADFVSRAGRLDVLVNNAGVLASGPLEETPLSKWHTLVDVNVKGVLNGCYLALPYLKRTSGARVINLCSASALYGQPSLAVYSATKFAVRGLTEALDLEWSVHGIKVMDVLPLFVQTGMVEDMNATSIRRMGVHLTARDVAQTLWRAAHYNGRLPKTHWTVGLPTRLFYGLSGSVPDVVSRFINSRITGTH